MDWNRKLNFGEWRAKDSPNDAAISQPEFWTQNSWIEFDMYPSSLSCAGHENHLHSDSGLTFASQMRSFWTKICKSNFVLFPAVYGVLNSKMTSKCLTLYRIWQILDENFLMELVVNPSSFLCTDTENRVSSRIAQPLRDQSKWSVSLVNSYL